MRLLIAAILLALITIPTIAVAEIPVEDRYGGVIATLGDIPQPQIDGMMDKVCGKGKWKLWKITTPDQATLPPQLKGSKAREHRFFCVPYRSFKAMQAASR